MGRDCDKAFALEQHGMRIGNEKNTEKMDETHETFYSPDTQPSKKNYSE